MNNQEKLIEELIPGIAHKSRNLLMNISGRIKLASVSNRTPSDLERMLNTMSESCEQLQALIDKLVAVYQTEEEAKARFNALDCLRNALYSIPPEIKNRFTIQNDCPDDSFFIEGHEHRMARSFAFLAEGLNESTQGHKPIQIQLDENLPIDSAYWRILKREGKRWLHITITVPEPTQELHSARESFFNPAIPFNPASCYLAAMENIITSHKGKIEYTESDPMEIHLFIPEIM